jgi:hypothetical protein
MTCDHGFIGPCAECDGCGQRPEPETVRAVVCRICDHVEVDPIDTWRCPRCKHANVLDVTEVPVL